MTYLEEYQASLEAAMSQGGTPAEMETCVREYDRAAQESYAPTARYFDWYKTAEVRCTSCQREFTPTGPKDPREEVACDACVAPKAKTEADSGRQAEDSRREAPGSKEA